MASKAAGSEPAVQRYPSWVQGHRGAKAVVPENTLHGFRWCIEQGVGSVELDVRLTADDVLVCVHDETLAAYGGPADRIDHLTAADVAGATLAHGEAAPTLQDVLDLAEGRLALNVEVKNDPRETSFDADRRAAGVLASLLDRRLDAGRTDLVQAMSSFDPGSVERFAAESAHHAPRAALLTQPGRTARRIIADAAALGVGAVHPHYSSLAAARTCARLLEQGLVVRTWTVNNRRVAERLVRGGVSHVVTDDPGAIADRTAS